MSNKVFKRFDVDLNNLSVPKKWQGTPLTDLYVDLYYNTIWHIEDLRKFFKNVPLDSTPETITIKETKPMTFEQTMHTIESHLEALQAEYDRLLEENIQLKTKNAKLMQFKKANTPMYKGEYNDA